VGSSLLQSLCARIPITMVYLLQHLLSESAAKYPERDAVVAGTRRMTYRELELISDKFAAVLIERGLKRGDRAAIYMPKSIESIVAIHAILKAGGVYVPLDANAPPNRLGYILQNCAVRCIVVSAKTAGKLPQVFPEKNPIEIVVIAGDDGNTSLTLDVPIVRWADVVAHPHAEPNPRPSIENDLAYILYTSGSTGVPKGVMISHRTSLTFVDWAFETFRLTSEDRNSSHAPLHFDLSIFDIFATLKAGAAIVLVPDGLSTFPVRLAEWIAGQKISVWYSVPSVLSMLVLRGGLDRLEYPNLRTILFAGEVFPVKYLRDVMKALPGVDFYNLYGPTETNVITYYKVPVLPEDRVKPIPIGRACANMDVFALTDDGGVASHPGEVGELYARGSCLAEGYWGDPDKTAKMFVENPLQPNFREYAYRTGDLVMLDEQGDYEFLGRRDHMVKSRGYRIELGEIESALYGHHAIKEAAAVAVPDDLIGNRIVAFVVLNESANASVDDLKRHCSAHIPVYMVPENIEFRSELPKTSTGKTDRPALSRSLQ
jgi:amino acid adenylation domain-containing protein